MRPAATLSPNSRRAYDQDRRAFEAWCRSNGRRALPMTPVLVAGYLRALDERGASLATVRRRLTGLRRLALDAGGSGESMRSPYSERVRATMGGIVQSRRAPRSNTTDKGPDAYDKIAEAVVRLHGAD